MYICNKHTFATSIEIDYSLSLHVLWLLFGYTYVLLWWLKVEYISGTKNHEQITQTNETSKTKKTKSKPMKRQNEMKTLSFYEELVFFL